MSQAFKSLKVYGDRQASLSDVNSAARRPNGSNIGSSTMVELRESDRVCSFGFFLSLTILVMFIFITSETLRV